MLPHAQAHNARIVTVNRRDYPGTKPYPPEELALLQPPAPDATTSELEMLLEFSRHRGQELLAFLAELVRERGIPPANPAENKGGIVVAGWSMGMLWMNALLGSLETSDKEEGGVDLSKYLRRVIIHGASDNYVITLAVNDTHRISDGASFLFGLPRPADDYQPMIHPEQFDPVTGLDWVGGYFSHGDTVDTLVRRTHDTDPLPTTRRMTQEEMTKTVDFQPGAPGGSDQLFVAAGYRTGLFGKLWEDAFPLPEQRQEAWQNIEVRFVWCDRSIWEATHAAWWVQAQVAEARAKGKRVRNVTTLRFRGANHFVSLWHIRGGRQRKD